MAFPIRFRLIDKATGKEFKGEDSQGNNFCAILYTSGQPARLKSDFYIDVQSLSCKDYELQVALEKDDKGNWIYKKVGY